MIILLYYVFAYHNQKTFKNLVFFVHIYFCICPQYNKIDFGTVVCAIELSYIVIRILQLFAIKL